MSTDKCDTKIVCTPERRQEKYELLLEDMKDESMGRYERAKAAFAEAAAQSGYDYAMKWRLEEVLEAEYLDRFMIPARSMLSLLVEGRASQEEVVANLELHAQELTRELLQQRPWEHHCTCAFTNLAGQVAATAKTQAVEKTRQFARRLSRIG